MKYCQVGSRNLTCDNNQTLKIMAEVVRKEPPVLIENVSVIINVFNIGHHGDLSNPGGAGQGVDTGGGLLTSGVLEGVSLSSVEGRTECSISHDRNCSPELNPGDQFPLGWIACHGGDVIPFGIQSIAAEIPKFGDRKTWKEIRVCLPPSLLADNETDLYCPVTSCREKLPRNKSMDSHIKKHLGLLNDLGNMQISAKNHDGCLPCPLFYYCQDKKCQYYVETAEKWFKAYKNVKQHYQKVHAPKPFECDMCQKTFSSLKLAETHKLMCGEKYSCSTCNASYTSLEALQTHCRRKTHCYDHNKYKDKRNSVKQEIQSLKTGFNASGVLTLNSSGRKSKITRKLPVILPKVSTSSNEVFNTIQALCQQAGVKVDYGCQTVCTAMVQKSNPVEAIVTPTTQSFAQKKRKSTDTQTNIVKFRATCLDQKHNATNTNVDWKKVITSDSQTQTADSNESVDIPSHTASDSSTPFNDEFATIKISEVALKQEPEDVTLETAQNVSVIPEPEAKPNEIENVKSEISASKSDGINKSTVKVDAGPSLFEEFISFLEATDSATQTDPDIFEDLGGDLLGINVNLDEFSSSEKNAYVSVSSTASQTAVESVSTKSLSAEDYEALLNASDDKKISGFEAISDYLKTVEGLSSEESTVGNQGGNDLFDWDHIVEEVYRDAGDPQHKFTQYN